MIQSSYAWLLIASRQEMHRVWGRFDHEEPGITTTQWLIAMGVLAAASLMILVWRMMKRRSSLTFSSDSSNKLFRELCAAHGVHRTGRRLLKRLADARGLKDYARLFFEPQHFEASSLPNELKSSAIELQRLRAMLFE